MSRLTPLHGEIREISPYTLGEGTNLGILIRQEISRALSSGTNEERGRRRPLKEKNEALKTLTEDTGKPSARKRARK